MATHSVILSIGSNIGNRSTHLQTAITLIGEHIGKIDLHSHVYESEAWGKENQRGFFNQVLRIESTLSASQILVKIHEIEKTMGRLRDKKWEARIIDIDILFYDTEVLEKNELVIPHPYLHLRNFILVPMLEMAPELVHPKLKKTIRSLYLECEDKLKVYLN